MNKLYKLEVEINGKIKNVNLTGINTYKEVIDIYNKEINKDSKLITINEVAIEEYIQLDDENKQYFRTPQGNEVKIYLNKNFNNTLQLNKKGEKTYYVTIKYLTPKEVIFTDGTSIIQDGNSAYGKATFKIVEKYIEKN